MRILAAEDNPISQTMLRSMLTKWGYDVVTAGDGNEAWQVLLSSDAPRMAILDWMMPGQDGVEVCRRLGAAGQEPYTYILLLTARSDAQDLVEAIDAGADDYLTKPFNSSELRARLRAGRRIVELQQQLLEAQEAIGGPGSLTRACHTRRTHGYLQPVRHYVNPASGTGPCCEGDQTTLHFDGGSGSFQGSE